MYPLVLVCIDMYRGAEIGAEIGGRVGGLVRTLRGRNRGTRWFGHLCVLVCISGYRYVLICIVVRIGI